LEVQGAICGNVVVVVVVCSCDFIIGSWEIWKLSLVVRLRMDGGPDVEARWSGLLLLLLLL
jgi:hypothetical protein